MGCVRNSSRFTLYYITLTGAHRTRVKSSALWREECHLGHSPGGVWMGSCLWTRSHRSNAASVDVSGDGLFPQTEGQTTPGPGLAELTVASAEWCGTGVGSVPPHGQPGGGRAPRHSARFLATGPGPAQCLT